jgi:hypothetical protein
MPPTIVLDTQVTFVTDPVNPCADKDFTVSWQEKNTGDEDSVQYQDTFDIARNALFFNAGTSRYVFTTDVSVNEVQAFIRDLVLVIGWFTPLDRYGR